MKLGISYSETCGLCGSQVVIRDALTIIIDRLLADWRKNHVCVKTDQARFINEATK